MRTLLNVLRVVACLATVACSNGAPAPVEPASPAPPSVPAPEPSPAKSDDGKIASCAGLRTEIDAQKSLSVLVTLADVSLDDQAGVDAAQKAVQAELPTGSTTDLRLLGIGFAATIQRPALEALCASPRVAFVAKPRLGKLN